MCSLTKVWGFLAAVLAAMLVAIGLVVAAAVANNSFFGAVASPGLILGAAAATAVAVTMLALATAEVEAFIACMGARSPACVSSCSGAVSSVRANLAALLAVLGSQLTACLVAAGFAWIPWAGAVPMYVIAATFILQVPLAISLTAMIKQMEMCLNNCISAGSSGTGSSGSGLGVAPPPVVTATAVGPTTITISSPTGVTIRTERDPKP